jgi:hypothetical protein
MNPYVFLVGCPRSGTTLLGRMLNVHRQVAVIHETRWIPRTFEGREGLADNGTVTPNLVDRLCDARALKPLGIDATEMETVIRAHHSDPFSVFVTALFDMYGRRRGKHLVGDKSPGYVRYLPTLHQLWPKARFVHIIRDGRDVCLSVLDWRKAATRFSTFDEDPVTTTAVWWEWYVKLGREAGSRLGPGLYHEIRYESLVADPEREAVRLCRFLEVPYDRAMLRFHEGRTRSKPGLSTKSAWLPVTGGLRDWRTQMDPADVMRFEAAAGDVLDELGYPRVAPSVPRNERERAESIRKRFAEQAHARQRPLPDTWSRVRA